MPALPEYDPDPWAKVHFVSGLTPGTVLNRQQADQQARDAHFRAAMPQAAEPPAAARRPARVVVGRRVTPGPEQPPEAPPAAARTRPRPAPTEAVLRRRVDRLDALIDRLSHY